MTSTQRTLAHYRDDGYLCEVVERWVRTAKGGNRKDLFGFIDLVAIADGVIVGIQATSTANVSARVKKIKTEKRAEAIQWLEAGGKIHVVGWKKYKQAVDRKYWRSVTVILTMEDFNEEIRPTTEDTTISLGD